MSGGADNLAAISGLLRVRHRASFRMTAGIVSLAVVFGFLLMVAQRRHPVHKCKMRICYTLTRHRFPMQLRSVQTKRFLHRLFYHERRALSYALFVVALATGLIGLGWYARTRGLFNPSRQERPLTTQEQRAVAYIEDKATAIYGLSGTIVSLDEARMTVVIRVRFPFDRYGETRTARIAPETSLSKTVFARSASGSLRGAQKPVAVRDLSEGDTVVVGSATDIKKATRFSAAHIEVIAPFQE